MRRFDDNQPNQDVSSALAFSPLSAMSNAPFPKPRRGDTWTYRIDDRLRQARFEETRRVTALDGQTITCEQQSNAPGYASGRWVYTREWNLISRPALGAPGDSEDDSGRWEWTPPLPLFRFPLRADDRLAGEARVRNAVTETSNLHRFARVIEGPVRTRLARPGAGDATSLAADRPANGEAILWRVRYRARVLVEGSDPPVEWINEETYDYAPFAQAVYAMSHRVRGPDGRLTRDAHSVLVRYVRAAA